MAWNLGADPTPLLEALGRPDAADPIEDDETATEERRAPRIHLPRRR
jgi:hypothetical protein